MNIQEALSHCYEGVKGLAVNTADAAVQAAKWGARTVVVIANYTVDGVKKVIEVITPHVSNAKDFLVENKPFVLVAVAGAAVGGILATVINKLCCTPTTAKT